MRSETIGAKGIGAVDLSDAYFKFCEFVSFSIEGQMADSDFFGCTFRDIDWYGGMFTHANFIECIFIDCVFHGCSFPDVRFVDCELTRCRFLKDNLGGDCDFSRAVAYGCVVVETEGFSGASRK
jgi:uncharacterized protein YjbI with pentapeptide repeats